MQMRVYYHHDKSVVGWFTSIATYSAILRIKHLNEWHTMYGKHCITSWTLLK